MDHTIQFKYSKVFAFFTLSILSLFLFLFGTMIFQTHHPEQSSVLRFFCLFLLILIIIVFLKYGIPAIKGQIALELNKTSIVDNIRNTTVEWSNVQDIMMVRFSAHYTKGIAIVLKDKNAYVSHGSYWLKWVRQMNNTTFGTPLVIPLQYIAGGNSKILKTMLEYWEASTDSP